MKTQIMYARLGAALSLMTALTSGCATTDETPNDTGSPAAEPSDAVDEATDVEAQQQELACTPLGAHCKTITECCIGRCFSGRCLKL
jgi:hypothetical protein